MKNSAEVVSLSTPFWEFLAHMYTSSTSSSTTFIKAFYSLLGVSSGAACHNSSYYCSWFLSFYSLLGVSLCLNQCLYHCKECGTFYSLLGVSYHWRMRRTQKQFIRTSLSTPFWEFLVRVLFKIFLSFSLKVFMKLIRTLATSLQNLALVF